MDTESQWVSQWSALIWYVFEYFNNASVSKILIGWIFGLPWNRWFPLFLWLKHFYRSICQESKIEACQHKKMAGYKTHGTYVMRRGILKIFFCYFDDHSSNSFAMTLTVWLIWFESYCMTLNRFILAVFNSKTSKGIWEVVCCVQNALDLEFDAISADSINCHYINQTASYFDAFNSWSLRMWRLTDEILIVLIVFFNHPGSDRVAGSSWKWTVMGQSKRS